MGRLVKGTNSVCIWICMVVFGTHMLGWTQGSFWKHTSYEAQCFLSWTFVGNPETSGICTQMLMNLIVGFLSQILSPCLWKLREMIPRVWEGKNLARSCLWSTPQFLILVLAFLPRTRCCVGQTKLSKAKSPDWFFDSVYKESSVPMSSIWVGEKSRTSNRIQ